MNVRRSGYDDHALMAWWERAYATDNLARNTYFQSPAWNRTWCAHFVDGDPRRESVLLRVERGGTIIAAVPLFLQRRSAGPLTLWHYLLWIGDRLAQYPDMATTEADAAEVWNAVHAWLSREYRGGWLLLRDVLPESTAATLRPGRAPTQDAPSAGIRVLGGETYLRVKLEGVDEDSYVRRCTSHMQREIRRARKRMQSEQRPTGLRWHARRGPSVTELNALIALNRARFGGASWFADHRSSAFLRELAAASPQDILYTSIEQNGTPLHAMLSYLHGHTVHYVLSGLDETARSLSPGTANLDRTICWAIGQGYRYFDFLRGDEPYKRDFAPECRESADLEWALPRAGGRRRLAAAMQRLRGVTEDQWRG